jgi:acyl-CoA thioesterase-1
MRLFRFLLLVLAFCSPSFGQQAASKTRTLIVFGDSITAGSALPKGQADQLWLKLVEKQAGGALTLINEGKGGRPSASVPEFEQMLKRQPKADGLIVALGMNDSRDLTPECVPKAVANVRAMIEKARQAYGATLPVLLLGPTNINLSALGPTKPIGPQRESRLRELGDAFALLAKETHCEYISLFGVVPSDSLLKDGVHPDAAGNAAMAKFVGPKLQGWVDGFR